MKIDFKKIICFGLAISLSGLYAQETGTNKEISMHRVECDSPDEYQEKYLPESSSREREEDYDYDVYTQGDGSEPEREPSYRRRACDPDSSCSQKRIPCSSKRKGAAKVAQE